MSGQSALPSGRLSEHDLDAFYRAVVQPALAGGVSREQPTLIVIAGQSGVGKTTAQAHIRARLGPGSVSLDGDDWVIAHPHYAVLARLDDRTAHLLVDADASSCSARAREEARGQRFDVVLSYPLGDPQWAQQLVEPFRRDGYRVEVVVVAEAAPLSRLGIIARYQAMRDTCALPPRYGRWVTMADHDHGYVGVVDTVALLEERGHVDAVTVVRRDGHVAYTNARTGQGEWSQPPRAATAIVIERSRSWRRDQADHFAGTVARLTARDRRPEALSGDLRDLIEAAASSAAALMPPRFPPARWVAPSASLRFRNRAEHHRGAPPPRSAPPR